jgi:cysteine desulfurase
MADRHYLDHASTSPVRPEARREMFRWLEGPAGDPGRIHSEGMSARHAVEVAREQVATLLEARPREVVFTSGATEAIASAVFGAASRGSHQVVTAVEHSAVREAAARAGDVTVVPVDGLGRVDPDEVLAAIRDDTACVHVQWGNHEVGTTQPLEPVVEGCRSRNVLVHVDAAQAAGRAHISFAGLGADLMSVSGHKMGAPPGIGALLVRRGVRLPPLLLGGDQERARRAGLENVPAIAGFGVVADLLVTLERRLLIQEITRSRRLTNRVLRALASLDGVRVYGDPEDRLPHLVCLGIDGIEPQAVLFGLDRAGVAAHSGSACSSESLEPSPVLEAMGVDAHRSLRISVGWSSDDFDVDALLDALPTVLADLRKLAEREP